MVLRTGTPNSVIVPLSAADQWALHHTLLQQIDRERTADDPSKVDPLPLEVFQAFEIVDAGEHTFTRQQCEAILRLLLKCHKDTHQQSTEQRQLKQLIGQVITELDSDSSDETPP